MVQDILNELHKIISEINSMTYILNEEFPAELPDALDKLSEAESRRVGDGFLMARHDYAKTLSYVHGFRPKFTSILEICKRIEDEVKRQQKEEEKET